MAGSLGADGADGSGGSAAADDLSGGLNIFLSQLAGRLSPDASCNKFQCPRCEFPLEKLNLDDLAKLSSAVFVRISEEKAAAADTDPKWNFEESSILRPRAAKDKESFDDAEQRCLSDARALLEDEEHSDVKARAFGCDWDLLLADKGLRILKVFGKGIKTPGDPKVVSINKAVMKHYPWLNYVYTVSAASDTSSTEGCYMNWLSFTSLIDMCGIRTKKGKGCDQRVIDTVFKAANFEMAGTDEDDLNPLNALNRSEWLEIIVRLAKARFPQVAKKLNKGVPWAVDMLVEKMKKSLAANGACNEDFVTVDGEYFLAVDLRDEWRKRDLYVKNTDEILSQWKGKLQDIFGAYSSKKVKDLRLMRLAGWTQFLEDTGMFLDSSFTRKEANMCFYFAKPTVVNPVKDVVRYECMDWCSFLEAITMIVRFKEFPSMGRLMQGGLESLKDLPQTIRDGVTSTWDGWMQDHPAEDESEIDPFSDRLDQLCLLLTYEFDRVTATKSKKKNQKKRASNSNR